MTLAVTNTTACGSVWKNTLRICRTSLRRRYAWDRV